MFSEFSKILRCPKCKSVSMNFETKNIICSKCDSQFPIKDNAGYLIDDHNINNEQTKMMNWWDDLCAQWYSDFDKNLTTEKLKNILPELEESLKEEDHLIFDLDLNSIKDKKLLHIGCGGGAADCILRKYGANIFSIDISGARAASTGLKHSLMTNGWGFAAQADAENIPCADNSFDIVYSNGVWMHSENYENIAKEALRVLKPGGKLVIMLYAKYSSQYFIHFLYDGMLKGYFFRYGWKYWLGAATEGKPKYNSTKNPFTAVFSFSDVEKLLHGLENISLKKRGFTINEIPFFGRRLKKLFMRFRNASYYHDAGIMRVGVPIYAGYLPIEKKLEKYIGWNIFISAKKPNA